MTRSRPGTQARGGPARGLRVLRVGLCALLPWVAITQAQGQNWSGSSNYVTITEARVEQLSNAVRVFLKADGTLECDVNTSEFWAVEDDVWGLASLKRFNISLLNARSGIGHYVDVDRYPASHVTLSVPTNALEGVGLSVALVLYAPGHIGKFQRRTDTVRDWGYWMPGTKVDMLLSENKQELILTVHTQEHVDPVVDKQPGEESQSRLRLHSVGDQWRLDSVRAPLEEVVAKIADASQTPVTLSPGVERRITANLPRMSALEILRTLCSTGCLELTGNEKGYVITTGTSDTVASYWAGGSRRIALHNVRVDAALEALPDFILRYLKADEDSNALVAYGPPQLLDKIEHDLTELDQMGRQLKVKVLVAHIRDPKAVRTSLSALWEDGTTSVGLVPGTGGLQVGVVGQSLNRVKLELQQLAQAGQASISVEPDVTVLSGQQAKIFVGKQQYYQFMRPTWYGVEPELRRVDVGVRLTASPWTGDGKIITVPFTIASDQIVGKTDEGLPTVSRQQAEGNLRITDRDCIVFGGLATSERFRQRLGFPSLKDGIVIGGPLGTRSEAAVEEQLLLCVAAQAVDREL